MADIELTYSEIFALARRWRNAGATVRLLCIHDADGNLVAGKLPSDMQAPGPIQPMRQSASPTQQRRCYRRTQ